MSGPAASMASEGTVGASLHVGPQLPHQQTAPVLWGHMGGACGGAWGPAMNRIRHLELWGLGAHTPSSSSHSMSHRGLRHLKEDPLPSAQEAAGGRPRFRPQLHPRHCLAVMGGLPASASAYLSTKWAPEGSSSAMLHPGDPENPLMHTTSPRPPPPNTHTQLRKTGQNITNNM